MSTESRYINKNDSEALKEIAEFLRNNGKMQYYESLMVVINKIQRQRDKHNEIGALYKREKRKENRMFARSKKEKERVNNGTKKSSIYKI